MIRFLCRNLPKILQIFGYKCHVGIVDTCMAEGVPLVCLNSVIHSDHLEKEIGFVGSSNYEAGKLQAEWLIENVDDSESVKMCYTKHRLDLQ